MPGLIENLPSMVTSGQSYDQALSIVYCHHLILGLPVFKYADM